MKIGGRFLNILLVALIVAGCATPEERRQREAANRAQIQACKSRGGTPYVSKMFGELRECLSAKQQAEVDKKIIACTRLGGKPNFNIANGLYKRCIYPNINTSGDYDWDWDYQPANRQWVCRGIQTGRYAELSNCAWDAKDDDRWPG
jgi:hypothetical protein